MLSRKHTTVEGGNSEFNAADIYEQNRDGTNSRTRANLQGSQKDTEHVPTEKGNIEQQ